MPYNNTPIRPPTEYNGTVSLPLARVKKIIAADEDISNCSNNAAFMIAVAAEMFVQYLVEQTHNVVKSERKVRRYLQYKDVANAVARIDNLEFLSDVVPRTTTYKEFKKEKAKAATAAAPLTNGQTTLGGTGGRSAANGQPGRVESRPEPVDAEPMQLDSAPGAGASFDSEMRPGSSSDPVSRQLEVEMRGPSLNGGTPHS